VTPGSAVVELGGGNVLVAQAGSTAAAGVGAPGSPVGATTVNSETTSAKAVDPLIQRVRRETSK
jgi:hypothetical protein